MGQVIEVVAIVAGAVVALVAIVAAWDAARLRIAASRFNQQTLDRLAHFEAQLDRQHEQQQAILGKLNAAMGAQASRMPRVGGMR